MKIGIIIYSQTGNTFSVAQQLQKKLIDAGHSAVVERIAPVGEQRLKTGDVMLEALPDLEQYDALVFASPVQGGSLAPAMRACLKQLPAFKGKPAACFVTMFFPWRVLGGTNAVNQMSSLCEEKGSKPQIAGIINWSRKMKRERQISETIGQITSLIKGDKT